MHVPKSLKMSQEDALYMLKAIFMWRRKEDRFTLELGVVSLVTLWLSFEALGYIHGRLDSWGSCVARSSIDCLSGKDFVLVLVILCGIPVLWRRQPALMTWVAATFFGGFVAGMCGIAASLVSPYPWWYHGVALLVGLVGATIVMPNHKLEYLLEHGA
jgi:hypothetical protein